MTPKILIIEDTPINLTLFTTIFKKHGFEVHGASDSREGLKLAKVMTFDIILCDLAMSGLDGGKLISILKSEDRIKDVPIVVVSGHTLEFMKVDKTLIAAYFPKPVQPGILIKKIQTLLPALQNDNNENNIMKKKLEEIEVRESQRKSTTIQVIDGFPVETVSADNLEIGMVTGDQVVDKNNIIIIPMGVALTDKFIEKLKSLDINEVLIRK